MNNRLIYIYSDSENISQSVDVLIGLGEQVALPYDFELTIKNSDIIRIPQEYIKASGIIAGGLKYINENYKDYDIIIAGETSSIEDIQKIGSYLERSKDKLVIGSNKNYDKRKNHTRNERFAQYIVTKIFNIVQGRSIEDVLNPLRGIPSKYVKAFSKIKGNNNKFLIGQIMSLRYMEIPIKEVAVDIDPIHYTKYDVVQLFKDISQILFLFIRFLSSSMISFIIDAGMIAIANRFFANSIVVFFAENIPILANTVFCDSIIISSAIARIVSSIFNFFVNQSVVFHANKGQSKWTMAAKYYILVIILWLPNVTILKYLDSILGIPLALNAAIAQIIIYALSYVLQRDFVFKRKNKPSK